MSTPKQQRKIPAYVAKKQELNKAVAKAFINASKILKVQAV